jgi:hypothetical protein
VSNSMFALGSNTVTCTATDAHGNAASITFAVIVTDTTAPVLSGVPTNRTVEATSPDGAVVTYVLPTAVDVVDGVLLVTCSPSSGSTFPLGRTTVNCTAQDAAGNLSTGSFSVTVRDTIRPVVTITNPTSNMAVARFSNVPLVFECEDSGAGVASCTPSEAVVSVNGVWMLDTATTGKKRVTVTAIDHAGNTRTQSMAFRVQ